MLKCREGKFLFYHIYYQWSILISDYHAGSVIPIQSDSREGLRETLRRGRFKTCCYRRMQRRAKFLWQQQGVIFYVHDTQNIHVFEDTV